MNSPRPFRDRVRRIAAGVGVTTLLVVSGGTPAVAAADDYRAEASGTGISLDLFGQFDLVGASSMALLIDEGDAAARGVGINQVESSISEVDLKSGSQRVPEAGDNCATPNVPEPLPPLPVGLGCSNAEANAGALNSANAEGFLGDVDLDGDFLSGLVDFLVDAVLADVAAALDAALEPLEDVAGPALAPVLDPLAEQCAAGLEQVVTQTDPVFGALDDLTDMDPTGVLGDAVQPAIDALQNVTNALPEACSSLLNLLNDLPEFAVIIDDLQAALADALGDLDLVQLSLGGTTSNVETTATDVTATATARGARLELPSLAGLLDAIETIVADGIGDVLAQIDDEIAETFDDLIPAVESLLQPVLDALMLPDLLDIDEPLLVLDAGIAQVTSSLDRNAVTTETSGTANSVVITLSSAFATLIGEENTTITLPGGDSATIGEDTPIETTISVLAVEEVSRDVDGESFTLTGTRAGGVSLDLFDSEELMGGISLVLAGAEAVVGGVGEPSDPAPAPDPDAPTPNPAPTPTLPVTGGGLALLGLVAAGGALALTRRRD